jgi:hypothetical protein
MELQIDPEAFRMSSCWEVHGRMDRGPRLWFTRAKPTIPLALLKLSCTLALLFTSHLLVQDYP